MKSGTSGGVLLLACVVFLAVTGTALAQANSDLDAQQAELAEAQARSHFETGSLAFAAGRYEDALTEFKKAYGLSPRPKLLYNIAVAADRLRRDREALTAFESYLQARPNAPERDEVRSRIVVLRGSVGTPSRATADADPDTSGTSANADPTEVAASDAAPATTNDANASARSSTPWILLGVGAVATVAGGTLIVLALMDKAAVEDAPGGSQLEDVEAAHDRVPLLSTVGTVTLGVGVVASGVGLAWLALRPAETPVEVRAGLQGFSVAGTF